MSNTDNHKKAIKITAACRVNKGMLTDIYYRILADQPSAIINAHRELVEDKAAGITGAYPSGWYTCSECQKPVSRVGNGGACIVCDPRGFD
jgi:hypothetical protein